MVRRLHASFSGSPWVGNGLDGELAQLVPHAGLTSAQTDAVIPPGTTVSSRSRSLKAEFRRHTTFTSNILPPTFPYQGGGPGVFLRSPLGAARSAGVNKRHRRRFWFGRQHKRKIPDCRKTIGDLKNGGYLLSQLVGQYHRRW